MGHVFRSDVQELAVQSLRRYLDAEVEPVYNREYRDRFVPKDVLGAIMQRLAGFGLVSGVVADERLGGLGLDWLTAVMLFEEVATTSIDLSVPVAINSFGASLLDKIAPEHLRERYLPGLLRGETFVSIAVSEPGAGSNVMEIRTRARRDGDDYIISGEKTWISNGGYSDFLICTCRTSDEPRGGLTHFLIDRKEHPYEVSEISKVAFNSQSTAQIFLSDVRVPAANILGEEGKGLSNTLSLFERSRVYVAAQAVGIARRALEETLRYTTERRQHGKVIAGHQLVAATIAEMATNLDAALEMAGSQPRIRPPSLVRRPMALLLPPSQAWLCQTGCAVLPSPAGGRPSEGT